MKTVWLCLWFGFVAAFSLYALDRDFHAIGDGTDAPQRLDVYRRVKGYTLVVKTDGRKASVTAVTAGKPVFSLNSDAFRVETIQDAYLNPSIKKDRILDGVTQITMVNADIVTAAAFMMFFIMVEFIPDGYATLIIAHTVICTPYTIMSILPKLGQLDPNVYEAGLDLGATPHKTLWKVMIPQLMPAILSGFALAFTISLDDFTISTFVSSSVETIPQYLYNKLRFKGVMPVLRALSTLILVVALVVLLTINIVQNRKKKQKTLF